MRLGRFGIWSSVHLWPGKLEIGALLQEQGFGTLWLGGSPGGDLAVAEQLLDATETLTIATGIVNVWADGPESIAAAYNRIAKKHPDRFLLGVGIGHPQMTATYEKPYQKLVSYLDALDAEGVPVEGRALAALGPKVLQLSADRTAGAHPYLTTPEHTRQAREILGPDRLLAPEVMVVLETDPSKARAVARQTLQFYLTLSNYTNNFRRLGFTDEDFADGGSDRLVDALVAYGEPEEVLARAGEHHDAGADHVTIQVLTGDNTVLPVDGFRALGAVLPR
ncbi:putative F420-dependent oxidoreductase [Kibdelosporangium banguiense]|uniref:F420-dependent oxidoreductase n=1 Tax=Kibdelosporangium banguiense TaxID=1365924 RepID=A0ABS4TDJ2_9PSEU|nr:LLM class F420-dependent oxidoreductase [Kibdelosporangium banguiense]MBP2322044.1 putative F420-dependent oxidoreductase [Kibdelosporangium banguiense]